MTGFVLWLAVACTGDAEVADPMPPPAQSPAASPARRERPPRPAIDRRCATVARLTSAGPVDVRVGPDPEAKPAGQLTPGATAGPVRIQAHRGHHFLVRTDAVEGWVDETALGVFSRGCPDCAPKWNAPRLHAEPDLDSDVVAEVAVGQALQLRGCAGTWWKIRVPTDKEGWIRMKHWTPAAEDLDG